MPKKFMWTMDKKKNERYSDIPEFGQDPFKITNEEDYYDYMETYIKQFTDVEQKIVDTLYDTKEPITMSKIKNIFTYAFLNSIFILIVKNSKTIMNLKDGDLVIEYSQGFIDNYNYIPINYPNRLSYNSIHLSDFAKDFFPIFKGLKRIRKGGLSAQLGREELFKRLGKTETEQLEESRVLISRYFDYDTIPSLDLIKASLEFLKDKNILNFRIQNNKHLWSLEKNFNISMRRLERYIKEQDKLDKKKKMQK